MPLQWPVMPKLTVRLPDDLHQQIVDAAEADRRSVNSELLWLIEQALQVRDARSAA